MNRSSYWTRRLVAAAVASLPLLSSAVAEADISKSACVDANTNAQNFRRDRKLSEARLQLQVCIDPKCPEVVRADCNQRLEELEAAQPTVVFDVKKPDGSDAADVKVSVDKVLLTQKLDGGGLKIDPGPHEVTFEIAGEPPIARTFIFKEGEKMRRERISFEKTANVPPAPPPAPVPATSPTPKPADSDGSALRYAGIGIGVVGIVGLAVGTVFGIRASSAWSDQQEACGSPTDCPQRAVALKRHQDATSFGTVATIGVIGGAVLLAGGALLYLIAPRGSSSSAWRTIPTSFTF